jgi:hypothetical protein
MTDREETLVRALDRTIDDNEKLRAEIERLRAVAQSVTHPALLKALNDLHVWLEIEGCGDQVEIINDAFSAAGITEYRCANCDGAGEWDEGPLLATSSTQISPDYRHVVCSDCEGKGTISLTSAQRSCEHDWKIWPETDGQDQRCMKCGEYRRTPHPPEFIR